MKNKFLAMIFSVVVAVGLWLFVITVVSPESEKTYFDIPVALQNKEILSQRGLMIVSDTPTVTLTLKSDRSILNELNENNIKVIADLTTVATPGTHDLSYTISYPGNIPAGSISVQSSSTNMINLKVENYVNNQKVPLVLKAKEGTAWPEGFYGNLENATFVTRHDNQPSYITHVEISGLETVVSPVAQAVIELDLNEQTEDINDEPMGYTLCDKAGNPVNMEKITTNVDMVQVSLQVLKEKQIAIQPQVIAGMGANESNADITLSQRSIVIRGEKAKVEALPDSVTIPVDLSEHLTNDIFDVELSELGLDLSGVEILKGKTTVGVDLKIVGVKTKDFTIPVEFEKLPKTFETISKTEKITVSVRGPEEDVLNATESDFVATKVDCTTVKEGANKFKVTVTPERFPDIVITSEHEVEIVVKLIPPEPSETQEAPESTESDTTTTTIPKLMLA